MWLVTKHLLHLPSAPVNRVGGTALSLDPPTCWILDHFQAMDHLNVRQNVQGPVLVRGLVSGLVPFCRGGGPLL